MKLGHWSDAVAACESAGLPYVIVTILGARGSTPRNSGTKMVVDRDGFAGTIGGGELEHRALQHARTLLLEGAPAQHVENFPLGEKLGQCCGGSVSLLFEAYAPQRLPTLLFGAGHVGRALAPLLASLPLDVQWIDERDAEFPEHRPARVNVQCDVDPLEVLEKAPVGAAYVIMTHNHPLDYALTEAALRRGDASFIGVIGSNSKARRFRLRLAHRGFAEEQIAAVHCPVGLREVPGKQPAEIAIAVAAQLITHYHSLAPGEDAVPGPSWKTLSAKLTDTAPGTETEPDSAAPEKASTRSDRSTTS